MNATVMCEFSKEEFTGGLVKMGCDSLDKLKKKIPELRSEVRDEDRFKDVYNYAYGFSCEVSN
jgi:DCN1-like protein 1/2